MLDLFDRVIEAQTRCLGTRGATERRAALAGKLAELDEERRGYIRQGARGILSDDELDANLVEIGEQRAAITAEMRRTQDAADRGHRIEAARESLASADWREDPDALTPDQWLTLGAQPEEIRLAYQRFGARFKVDEGGALTLRLELDLGEAPVAKGSHPHGNELWVCDDEAYMRRRDASVNDYEIDESEHRYR
jgi:hypothetical protein